MRTASSVPDRIGEITYIVLVVVSFGLLMWFWSSLWVPSQFPF